MMSALKVPLGLRVGALYMLSALMLMALSAVGSQASSLSTLTSAPRSKLVLQKKTITGHPTKLIIPKLDMKLNIKDGNYNSTTNTWELSDDAVHYATITSNPNNETGNTFLYGHNTEVVLGKTDELSPGDLLIIKTSNNRRFTYVYSSSKNTTANDITPLQDKGGEPYLTLLTCDGIWSEQRRVMIFNFKDVQ